MIVSLLVFCGVVWNFVLSLSGLVLVMVMFTILTTSFGKFFYKAAGTQGFAIIGGLLGFIFSAVIFWFVIKPYLVEAMVGLIDGILSVLL